MAVVDTGVTELVAAVAKLKANTVPLTEWVALKQKAMELEAENLLETFSQQGKLTQAMYLDHKARLTKTITGYEDRKLDFIAMMGSGPVIVPQGVTTPPDDSGTPQRDTVIRKAARRFDSEPELKKSTNKVAWIDAELQDKGLPPLTADERAKHG